MTAPHTVQNLESLNRKKRPIARSMGAALALCCVLVCVFATLQILALRRDTQKQAEISTSNIARGLAMHAETTIRSADFILENMVERIQRDGMAGAARETLEQHLVNIAGKTRELHGLFVYDERGSWIATSLQHAQESSAPPLLSPA